MTSTTMFLESEMAVLGSVFIDNDVMHEISTMLEPRDFSQTAHELIWKAMRYQYSFSRPIDFLTMTEMLMQYKRLEEVGGLEYLVNLSNSVPSTKNVKYYASQVRKAALRRRGLQVAEEIRRMSTEEFEDDESYFFQVDKLASSLRPQEIGNMKHLKDSKENYLAHLDEHEDLIKTGFPTFDEWSGGVGRGWLYILAGRPSVGKTAKMLQMTYGFASQGAGEVLVWSQEMGRNQLLNRMMSSISRIHAGRIRKKTLEQHERQKLVDTYEKLEQLPIHIDDASGVTIDQIAATARQIKRKYGKVAAIIVDYLTIMNIKQERGQTWSKAVGEVTKRAKWLAKELDCVFVMLAQLNRDGADGEPQMQHLRDSGEIEQDADVIEFLWHNPEETHQNGKVIQSFVAKARDIGVNRFKYVFVGYQQRYEELS